MATRFFACALLALLSLQVALSATPSESESSPSPSPELPADSPFLSVPSPSPSPSPDAGSPFVAPVDSPVVSPPAPPPSDLLGPGASPSSAPAHSPDNSGVPAPAPMEPSDINHSNNVEAGGDQAKEDSGMSGGKKAGIALGVILALCVVVVGGLVYKKRQDNIRRSRYGYAARGELL
ncbi:hypothetical protein P3X46_010039 [Hevea brasiliensis]|uniref:Uncharacterized protein n=1 Tax=Hevea brasiliensis TaxID=3981 RepID=A0ABQ9MCT7_HEVBR|nr:alpha carbonic anhydrase 8-like [Hevea brasiliensis]KAJ9178129.1 hypothetical protein P3X46_010039 [Hevea brasiliensis]